MIRRPLGSSRLGMSRRRMLQTLGLGALASPLVPLLNASGQTMEFIRPKRLLLVFTPDGAAALDWNNRIDWRPTGTATDFTLHRIHAPLEPMKSKLAVPWGLKHTSGGAGEGHAYGMAGLWTASTLNGPSTGADFDGGNGNRTGWGSAASVDQLVAQAAGPDLPYQEALGAAQQETPYRSVELSVQSGNPTSLNRMIYAAPNTPLHPESNPRAAFDRLFAGVVPSGEETVEDPAAVRRRAEQGAIVDLLRGDLGRIKKKIGSEDYVKLDKHLEGLLAIEQRLNQPAPGLKLEDCSIPEQPAQGQSNNAAFPTQIRQMMDITAHMLACDVTRVASLQISYGFSNVTHTWLNHTSAHHTMSHDETDRREELQDIDNWYSQQFLYLLEQLDAVQEGEGTLLDNTLVVWGRELGSTAHRMERAPFVVAGGKNLGVRQNYFLDVDGQEHAKLLVSIAQIMGLQANSVGNRAMDSGPLSGLVV